MVLEECLGNHENCNHCHRIKHCKYKSKAKLESSFHPLSFVNGFALVESRGISVCRHCGKDNLRLYRLADHEQNCLSAKLENKKEENLVEDLTKDVSRSVENVDSEISEDFSFGSQSA